LGNELDDKKHPIAAAILGAVVVENLLETRLRDRLAPRADELWDKLTGENGALGTLHRKIQMARALRIIDDATQHNINIVKDIRNAFAHAKTSIDFDHALVLAEL